MLYIGLALLANSSLYLTLQWFDLSPQSLVSSSCWCGQVSWERKTHLLSFLLSGGLFTALCSSNTSPDSRNTHLVFITLDFIFIKLLLQLLFLPGLVLLSSEDGEHYQNSVNVRKDVCGWLDRADNLLNNR